MTTGGIPLGELDEDTLVKLGLVKGSAVTPTLYALSMIIRALNGLTTKQALWVLREAIRLITGERDKRGYKPGKEDK